MQITQEGETDEAPSRRVGLAELTTDTWPELSEAFEYAVYVLNEFCRGRCKDELGLLVPTCACYNLRAFALHMDQLGEKRVMLAFAHHRAVELVVELMHGKRAQVSCVREGEETRRVAARTGSAF